jgi:glycosyltransferase involved in cell wall biosynthesis
MGERYALRVAIVAPPYYSLPPRDYGGIELVCHTLAESLMERGHAVTLIGAGKAQTRASFVATFDEPQPEGGPGAVRIEMVHAARAARTLAAGDFDVIHDHTRVGPLTAPSRAAPTVVTVHAALAGPEMGVAELQAVAAWVRPIAVSEAQRQDAPHIDWAGMVHNGIPLDRYPLVTRKEPFALYLGRISPYKGIELSIAAARAAGRPLVIAGSWTVPAERDYFETRVRPLLGGDVEWVGPVGMADKVDLLGRAGCLLFPPEWREPFGLVVIEAMACGTPVVALRRGAVTELVDDGVTGVVCGSFDALTAGIEVAAGLLPSECRAHVERHFTAEAMARGYEQLYRRVLID